MSAAVPQPSDVLIPLRAGPLTMLFDRETAFLRYIRLGRREVVRGIYAAVRDRNWDTITPRLSGLRVERGPDAFTVTFSAECREREAHFAWRGEIVGSPDGGVTFRMAGAAKATFLRNRIGFCLLHPPRECAGRPCRVEHADGTIEEGLFPAAISPHQPFREMSAIAHEAAPGVWAEVRFEGDVFEMEDQRNWTDASYKTYCTPLSRPFPVELVAGTEVRQSVTLTLRGVLPSRPEPAAREPLRLSVSSAAAARLPAVGFGLVPGEELPGELVVSRLRAARPSHLRIDLRPGEEGAAAAWDRACRLAGAVGASLEAVLFVSDAAEAELAAFAPAAAGAPAGTRWIVLHRDRKASSAPWAGMARRALGRGPDARVGGGTNAYFTELNRARPSPDEVDFLCYSLNPQVHAFDDRSLVETLPMQETTTACARALAGGKPVVVTPVTLRPRFNPNATGPDPEPGPEELPHAVDARQSTLFCAAWTVGSLRYLARGGAASVTYYETHGWRGLMARAPGEPSPERGPAIGTPGSVFPVYHVLADAGEFSGAEVLASESGDPLRVEGLALRAAGRTRLLLANLTAEAQAVRLEWDVPRALVRRLDADSLPRATSSPEAYRKEPGSSVKIAGGLVDLELPPHAVLRLDAEPPEAG